MKKTKLLKKITAIMVTGLTAVALFAVGVFAEEEKLSGYMQFTLPNGFEYTTRIIAERKNLFDENGEKTGSKRQYSFVLPYNAQNSEITFKSSDIEMMYRDGAEYLSGGSYVFAEGVYKGVSKGNEVDITVQYTSDIYQVYLTLEEEISVVEKEKGNEVKGKILITDGLDTEYDGGLDYIKGRGNSSWFIKKKPYNIKTSTKVNLLDMGVSKKFAFIPMYYDKSMVRETIAVQLGKAVGIDYCLDGTHVDLYIDGEYRGVYYLTERVEVDQNRINIFDLENLNEQLNAGLELGMLSNLGDVHGGGCLVKGGYKWMDVPNSMADRMDGGYLLEYDLGNRYDLECSGFVSDYGQPVVVKSPEYASKGQVEYISEYYQQFEDALLSDDGYNKYGKHYSDYIDVESFAKVYVFQEYALNLDAGMTSTFMYKDIGGKLTMCTVWDLDHGFGFELEDNAYDVEFTDTQAIWATVSTQQTKEEKSIFTLLCQHADFRQLAAEIWTENFAPEIPQLIQSAAEKEELIISSAKANYLRWIFDRAEFEEFTEENIWLREFLQLRAEFMNSFMSKDASYVIYNRNGADGAMLDKYSYLQGAQAQLFECEYTYGDAQFLGWNTKADGSGTSYMPGDIITIENEDVVLYAQWNAEQVAPSVETIVQPTGLWAAFIGWIKGVFNL